MFGNQALLLKHFSVNISDTASVSVKTSNVVLCSINSAVYLNKHPTACTCTWPDGLLNVAYLAHWCHKQKAQHEVPVTVESDTATKKTT